MVAKIQVQDVCSAYALCQAVLNPNPAAIRPDTIFPEGSNYEITQIFLDRLQKCTEQECLASSKRESLELNKYFSKHFPSFKLSSKRKFPVEILWAAYGIADDSNTSCWALFYKPFDGKDIPPDVRETAKTIRSSFEKILKAPSGKKVRDEISFLQKKLFLFLYPLNRTDASQAPGTPLLYRRGEKTFPRFYNASNLGDYYKKHQNEKLRSVYIKCFQEIETLCSKKGEVIGTFLAEWKSMKPYEKSKARNYDPFVKEFESIFDKIRSLMLQQSRENASASRDSLLTH